MRVGGERWIKQVANRQYNVLDVNIINMDEQILQLTLNARQAKCKYRVNYARPF